MAQPSSVFKVRKETKYLVVHCSATPPKMDVGVKEIRAWHLQKKFADIGYHYVIRRDGTVEEGRALEVMGAHVENFNDCSVGVCLVGGVSASAPDRTKGTDAQTHRTNTLESHPENNFTDIQFRSLFLLIHELSEKYPEAQVCGHRDFPHVAKACPSFDVRPWLAGFTLPKEARPVEKGLPDISTTQPQTGA